MWNAPGGVWPGKIKKVLILPACVRARGPLMIPAPQSRRSFAQGIQHVRLMPLSAFPHPSKAKERTDRHDILRGQESPWLLRRIISHHSPIRICLEPGTWNVKVSRTLVIAEVTSCLSQPPKKSVEYDFYYERMPLTICRIMAVTNMRLIPVKTP